MSEPEDNVLFRLTEPQKDKTLDTFVCWLTTEKTDLFSFVVELACVGEVRQYEPNRAMVVLKDSCDPDETWHYLRTELEDEANYVELDDIWNDAMWF